jgi:hypothetical protein
VPRLLLHSEQWQCTIRVIWPPASNATSPHKHPPATMPGWSGGAMRSTTGRSTPGGYAANCGSLSLIVVSGDFDPTKMCERGLIVKSPSSVPAGTSTTAGRCESDGTFEPQRPQKARSNTSVAR